MKNSIIKSLTIGLVLLSITSCNKTDDLLIGGAKFDNMDPIHTDPLVLAISASSAGDIHTRITEFCYDKIVEWRNAWLTNDQIRDKIYDDVFIRELSRITGYSTSSISNQLRYNLQLTKSNISSWSIYDFPINHQTYNNLYNDLQSLVNQNYSIRGWSWRLASIKTNYTGSIPSDHLNVIIDVANSSYTYWYSNYQNWIDIPNSGGRIVPLSQNTILGSTTLQRYNQACAKSRIVGGDIRGAISGFLSSAWSGLGALGGSVVGAMVGTLVGATEAAFTCGN